MRNKLEKLFEFVLQPMLCGFVSAFLILCLYGLAHLLYALIR